MGACNCKEEDNFDNGNIDAAEINGKVMSRRYSNAIIVRPKAAKEENSYDLNKENLNPNECCDSVILAGSVKIGDYQTRGEELPFSQYASVQQVDSEKGDNQLDFKNGQFKENSFTKANDSEKELEESKESIVLTFEQEYQYTELSTNIYNFLNNLRTTPEKFENEIDQRLGNVFKMLLNKEEKPEFILWSQNLYDTCFEKFMAAKNENIQETFDELTQTILEKLGAVHDKSHSIIISCHMGKYEAKNVIWNLLANEDDQLVHSILFDNFIYGTVVSLPVDKELDRYLLILIKRN